MYRFLLSRQWVLLTLVAALLIPLMVKAGFWQLHRHEQRVERNDVISAGLAADPVPMDTLTAPGRGPADGDRYRAVTATGVYDQAAEVVVRQRSNPGTGELGYYVLTPLVRDDGPAVLVNRGWVPAGGDPTRVPAVPAAPVGEVTVTGRLMADESTARTGIEERAGLPAGMVMLVDSAARAEADGRPMLGGYLELASTEPGTESADGAGGAPELLPAPDHSGIGAHFAYAVQWWLFAAMVPVGWVLLARREARERGAAQATAPRAPARAV